VPSHHEQLHRGLDAAARAPRGLALHAASGTLFVADAGNSRVRAIALASGNVTTFAGGVDTGARPGTLVRGAR
jgi:DNA-binding beta-propeller fold protein YncE